MTRHNLDDTTRQVLLGLDPAPADLDATDMRRADESLARILALDPDRAGISGYVPPTPRRMRRVALLGALAIVTPSQLSAPSSSAGAAALSHHGPPPPTPRRLPKR